MTQNPKIASYASAIEIRDHLVWIQMDKMTVGEAAAIWLNEIPNKLTLKNYTCALNRLIAAELINPTMSLQAFALMQHSEILKKIKLQSLSEATKQARCAAYISFTRHLAEKYEGNFNRAIPSKDPKAKTFTKIRDVVETQAMNREQWTSFLEELQKINPRDCLIAKLLLQGCKRVNEVLSLTTDKIDWDQCQITFKQSKTGMKKKDVIITYPHYIMKELKDYIDNTQKLMNNLRRHNPENEDFQQNLVFITRNGKKILTQQIANTFAQAGLAAGIPFKIHPHVLRASNVTYLKKMGMSDSDIMKVSGHADSEMVAAYDKSCRSDNASKKVCLV